MKLVILNYYCVSFILEPHTWVLACLYNVSFNASDSSEVLNMSLTSKGCSSLAALRNPSRLLGKLGRPSRSRREPSSIHLHSVDGWRNGAVWMVGRRVDGCWDEKVDVGKG